MPTNNVKIGRAHGSQAEAHIKNSIAFYAGLFQRSAGMGWPEVQQTALEFVPSIESKWPAVLEEMQGEWADSFRSIFYLETHHLTLKESLMPLVFSLLTSSH
jgi:hypothetical protein